MEIKLKPKTRENSTGQMLLVILRRVVALILLVFAITYWGRIIGFEPATGMRFDTMTEAWQIVSPVMAVGLPVAAIGLWGLFPWGTSSWLFVMAIELLMYLGYPEIFGTALPVVVVHLASLAIYLAIKLSMMVARRGRPRSVSHSDI